MTLNDIALHRLAAQQLNTSQIRDASELVTWFGAIQAQEYAQTKWSIGLRLPQLNDKTIEDEISDGKLIRTHLLRPTWHLVAAEDLRWMLMLTAPRVNAINAYMYRKMEVDAPLFKRCHRILTKALEGNRHLTRDELHHALANHKIKAEGTRLACILMESELRGLICSGIKRDKQFTYALLEERVAPVKEKTKEEALAELTKRYFKSRGPANLKDYATWSGLTTTDCRKGIDLTGTLLGQEKIGDELYYFDATIGKPPVPKGIQLLPIYDEYIMGYKNREAILQFKNSIQQSFSFDNTIVLNGQIIGSWKRTIKPNIIALEYQLLKSLSSREQTDLKKQIARFGRFYGLPISVSALTDL